jgi:hypothetical protein
MKKKKVVKCCKEYNSLNEFAVELCKLEGKNIQMNIAQVKELLHCINHATDGAFYRFIKNPSCFIEI